ncbi:fungal hydrophobin [Leucogyrophana mollusca]|uniref:Fungal hydrophobin n=1 Tax=Leucogyrophana mollusca TaxID=85980 RepID=A0ACB8B3J1_9AGAM|nr:fungal hydrophobin [Leucogyrophana mollusca]
MIASRIFAVLPLAALALAGGATNQCNTGSASCCDSTQTVSQAKDSGILGFLGAVDVGSLTGLVGTNCSPLTVVGTGSGCQANQEPVCCTDNHFNGLVNVGCSPLNLNL